jgi:hypothetical protein
MQKRKSLPGRLRCLYPLVGKTQQEAVDWLRANVVEIDGWRVKHVYTGEPRTLTQWPPSVAMTRTNDDGVIVEILGAGD